MLHSTNSSNSTVESTKAPWYFYVFCGVAVALLISFIIALGCLVREIYVGGWFYTITGQIQHYENVSHGETLEDFVAGVEDEEFESVGYFLPDGNKIIELSDFLADSVTTPGNLCDYLSEHYESLVMVHNHPVQYGMSTSFSDTDLKTFGANTFVTESIVVSENFIFHIKKEAGRVITREESEAFFEDFSNNTNDYIRDSNQANDWLTEYYCKEGIGVVEPVGELIAEAYAWKFGLDFWIEPQAGVSLMQYDGSGLVRVLTY